MANSIFSTRIDRLSHQLAFAGVDLYLQPVGDEFQGEYVPEALARLPWLTGFTGSAGLGAFWTKAHGARRHALFTDGRYTIQAAQQLVDTGVAPVNSGDVTLTQWLADKKPDGLRIGYDPWLITQAQLQRWHQATAGIGAEWIAIANPVDAIWEDRPAMPTGEVVIHPVELAGVSYEAKRTQLLQAMFDAQVDALVLTLPDGINWLLNIRGQDIPYNPLLLGYLVLRAERASLYLYDRPFNDDIKNYLIENNVDIKVINCIFSQESGVFSADEKVWIDPASAASGWWSLAEKSEANLVAVEDPTLLPKACKNHVELDGVRAAHRRDGLALTRFLAWLDAQYQKIALPDELGVVEQLERFRRQDNSYRGPSFATIAGSGPNGAIVHYRADEKSNRRLRKGDMFLLDSGGQYPDGTTDVTRTISLGESTTEMKQHNTRVLKGHIALARARFPEGTSGQQLDVLARQFLWETGLDYDHGTGHGVGAYLCVHEGPQRISKKGSAVPLVPGMILSNEPGYYAEGKYGIRIENLVAVVEVDKTAQGKKLLGFETLTLVPIDTKLVDVTMLTTDERNWLNHYHQHVYKTHIDALDVSEKRWLAEVTRAI